MVQAHRLEGTALARVAAAKQLVELKPHHLDGGEQRLQAHHENIAQHDHDQVHHRAMANTAVIIPACTNTNAPIRKKEMVLLKKERIYSNSSKKFSRI